MFLWWQRTDNQLGIGGMILWESYGTPPAPTLIPTEDRVSIGTIFGAQLPEPHIGGF